MHYPRSGISLADLHGRETLHDRVRREVVPDIPEERWQETSDQLPLQHRTDPWTIAWSALRFCTGELRSYAVYVLECMYSKRHRSIALSELGIYRPTWRNQVDNADRLLYVGRAKNLTRRLHQHLNEPGDKGANFTAVFPPVRILNVSWYSSKYDADRAERATAELLRKRFPDDYVSQPG